MFRKLITLFIFVNLLALDIFIVYRFFYKTEFNKANQSIQTTVQNTDNNLSVCGEECKSEIAKEVAMLNKDTISVKPSPTISKTVTPAITANTPKTKSVSYIPIPGSGNTVSTSWTNVQGTDFYLKKSDYSGFANAYFEANVRLLNGNGKAFVRLFDVTHSIAVVGSDIETSSQTSVFVGAGPISLWEGYNHYIVQVRSLTADTSVFESGRLKITTEN